MGFFDRFKGKDKQDNSAVPQTPEKTNELSSGRAASRETYDTADLFYAACNGDLMMVRMLLSDGASPNVFVHGYPALYYPVVNNYNEVAIALLNAGANPNAISPEGMFPLYAAAENGNLTLIKSLLDNGAEIDKMTPKGCTALRNAAEEGRYDVVDYLLSAGADVDSVNKAGYTILDAAMRHGQSAIVNLIQQRFPNAKTTLGQQGETPRRAAESLADSLEQQRQYRLRRYFRGSELVQGIVENNPRLVGRALGSGEDPNQRYSYEEESDSLHEPDRERRITPIVQATFNGNHEIVRLLIEHGADPDFSQANGETALADAANIGDVQLVQYLIDNGANPNKKTPIGTPLALADGAAVMQALLENGADPNIADRDGDLPIIGSIDQRNMDEIELLIRYGTDLNHANNSGQTPLDRAMRRGIYDEVNRLADNRSSAAQEGRETSVNEPCNDALIQACKANDFNMAMRLLKQGADPNAVSQDGRTPLFFCSEVALVSLLVHYGANVNATDNEGNTPLMTILKGENIHSNGQRAIMVLIESGADTDVRNAEGLSACDIAASRKAVPTEFDQFLMNEGKDVELGNDEEMSSALSQGMKNAAEKRRALEEKLSQQRARRDEWHREMSPFADGDFQAVILNCFIACTVSDMDVLKAHEDIVRSYITTRMKLGNMQEQTMLMAACTDASADIVEYLLSLGADVNQVDDTGQASLRYAAVSWMDTEKKIELLLNAGADINHFGDDGSAALSDAAFHHNVAAVRKLLASGADVNNRDSQGYTALSWACGQGAPDADIVELLLRYGANVSDLYDMGCVLQYLDYANGSGWKQYQEVWLRQNEVMERYFYEHALLPAMLTPSGREKFESAGF